MTLWFENQFGEARQIAHCESKEDVYRSIDDFIAQANARKSKGSKPFKSYYVRSWEQDGKTWYDVGSHVEFFYTTEK